MNVTRSDMGIGTALILLALFSGISSVYFAVLLTSEFPVPVQIVASVLAIAFLLIEYSIPKRAVFCFRYESDFLKGWILILVWLLVASYSWLAAHVTLANITQAVEESRAIESSAYQEAKQARERAEQSAAEVAVSAREYQNAKANIDLLQEQRNALLNSKVSNSNNVPVIVSSIVSSCERTSFYNDVCNQLAQIDTDISYNKATIRRYSEYQSKLAHFEHLQEMPLPQTGIMSANVGGFESVARLFSTDYSWAKTALFSFIAFLVVALPPILIWSITKPDDEPEPALIPPPQYDPDPVPVFKRDQEQDSEKAERARKRHELQAKLANVKQNAAKLNRAYSRKTKNRARYGDDELYEMLEKKVKDGTVKPSIYGLKGAITGYQLNSKRAKKMQARLAKNGVIKQVGNNAHGGIVFELNVND